MDNAEINKLVDKRIEQLLSEYHHYLFMAHPSPLRGWFAGMSIGGFMQWLKSKNI